MDLKGAEIRNVKNLCSEMGSKENVPMRVNIPYYQRPYKWGEDNIKNLINDFKKNEENGKDGKKGKKEYFVGSAVMVVSAEKNHDVIDGQQRITTMFLFTYLEFLLQRAYVEELLSKKRIAKLDTALQKLEEICNILFGSKIEESLKKVHTEIIEKVSEEEQGDNLFDILLENYQKAVFLPEKNLTDEMEYADKYYIEQKKLLKKCDLSLKYNRESYNEKLKEALSSFVIFLTDVHNPKCRVAKQKEDELVKQYIDAMKYEFNGLCNIISIKGKSPIEYTNELISEIDSMLEHIKFCVIITGNENDAYTLFEVLNDRALDIEDLDLIKNLFYKWYCHHTKEDDDTVDECIEEVDEIWVEKVFTPITGKDRAKMISYFAAVFFTADDALKYNDSERYREVLENKYLNNKNEYNSVDIKNDIGVYQMIAILLENVELAYQHKNMKCVEAEISVEKSITYKTFHLLNALKQYGVLSALINVIVKQYIDNHTGTDGAINIDEFGKYVDEIIKDYKNNNEKFIKIHEIAFELWRFALLCPSADMPRQEAKKKISLNNVNRQEFSYTISLEIMNSMKEEFLKWINAWKYGKGDSDLKAKVLFINLFNTEKRDNYLELLATGRSFRTPDIQLDHMEADNINHSAEEKYFKPKNIGEQRNVYTDTIGNFMILDSKDNNNKDNRPLEMALEFYDNMSPHHWMIEEVRELLQDDRYSKSEGGSVKYRVPVEEFFTERRNRLLKYFTAILSRKLNDEKMPFA